MTKTLLYEILFGEINELIINFYVKLFYQFPSVLFGNRNEIITITIPLYNVGSTYIRYIFFTPISMLPLH